jgi:hypothetical protein
MQNARNWPNQQLPFSKKTKEWRKKHLDWAENRTFFQYGLTRRSVIHKRINYDLLNGRVSMRDMALVVNPEGVNASYLTDKIQHYPIMNSKLNVLRGEESKRVFDYRVVITNPEGVSEVEDKKKEALLADVQNAILRNVSSEEEFNKELESINDYFMYDWQDMRETRANSLMDHYVKELAINNEFNAGFMDAMAVGEEIYQCDIVGGEPTFKRLNPLKVRIFRSGYSNKIEDADIIIFEDYVQPGKIIDAYYDVLSAKDIEYIENIPDFESSVQEGTDIFDERANFIYADFIDGRLGDFDFTSLFGAVGLGNNRLFYDNMGNVRVLTIYWKSRRKIKRVKSYDPLTGEPEYNFYTEKYVLREDLGEEEEIFWINEAWEATKIGAKIYVNMRPRPIQYNRLSNPSRCHFGITGTIYSLNENRPFSMVDMMKSYNYYYDVIHDRLNKAMAMNWGKLVKFDFSQIPDGWDVEQWMYYARKFKLAVVDSFKEGNIGASTGRLAGNIANTQNVVDADLGNYIQQHINLLEFIKLEMSEVVGITRQREGQISNRETVGGVERATLQSSHITEWLFSMHDDTKKRALECFLETAKIALRGGSKKFQYLMPDLSTKIIDIDGDEFAECDYGLVVDNSQGTQMLNERLDSLAQAALQNSLASLSTITQLYDTTSIAYKKRLLKKDEQEMREREAQTMQQNAQMQQQQIEANAQLKMQELAQNEQQNIRDNETKILVEQIKVSAKQQDEFDETASASEREKLLESMRQFDKRLQLDKEKLASEEKRHREDNELKNKISIRQSKKPKSNG